MELYYSVDVEADGPIPGKNSMLSFGCAVFTAKGNLIDTYSANLDLLEGANPINKDGTLKIYEYTEDNSTFSGYSSVLSESITIYELIKLYKENGFKLTINKLDK